MPATRRAMHRARLASAVGVGVGAAMLLGGNAASADVTPPGDTTVPGLVSYAAGPGLTTDLIPGTSPGASAGSGASGGSGGSGNDDRPGGGGSASPGQAGAPEIGAPSIIDPDGPPGSQTQPPPGSGIGEPPQDQLGTSGDPGSTPPTGSEFGDVAGSTPAGPGASSTDDSATGSGSVGSGSDGSGSAGSGSAGSGSAGSSSSTSSDPPTDEPEDSDYPIPPLDPTQSVPGSATSVAVPPGQSSATDTTISSTSPDPKSQVKRASTGTLPQTGVDAVPMLVLGGGLVVLGGGLVALGRGITAPGRRRRLH